MAAEFNPIIPTDLSQDTPQANIHVPSVADPGKYQPQFTPAGYNMDEPQGEDTETPGFSDLMQRNAPKKVFPDAVAFNPAEAKRYDDLPFNPNINNEDIYAKNQGVFSQMGNATAKFAIGAGVAFAETLMSIPDLVRGATGGNIYKNNVAQGLDNFQNNMENVFPNFYTDSEKEHPFMSAIPFHQGFTNFLWDKLFKGSGLVVGTVAGVIAENAIIGLATGGAGNAAAEGAIIEGATSQLARAFGKASLNFSKLATTGSEFQNYLRRTKVVGEALKDATKMEEYAAGVKLGSNLQYGLTLSSSSSMMAALGARETYKSTKDLLERQFMQEHGYAPDATELGEMERVATTAANTKYGMDFVLFTIQNAIAFPNAMKGFSSAKAGIKEGLAATTEGQVGKIGIAEAEIKTATDIDNLILTPESTKARIFRKYARPGTILAEGVGEGLEYGTAKFAENYYTNVDKENTNNLMNSAFAGFKAAFGSDEGLEATLIGGLMGGMLGPVEHAIQHRVDLKSGKLSPEKASQVALANMRKNSVTGLFEQNYASAADALAHSRDMKQAVADDDIFKYKNLQASQLKKMVMTGIRSNRFDVVKEQIRMLKELPEAELNKVMGTPTDSEATLQEKHDYIDSVVEQADKLKKDYDAVSKVFLNKFEYRPDAKTDKDKQMNNLYLAYEDVKEDLVGASFDIRDRKARLTDIGEKLRAIHPDLTTDLARSLSSMDGLQDLQKEYEERSKQLQIERDELGNGKDEFARERYEAIRKERGVINSHIDAIEGFLGDIKKDVASLHDQADLFQQLASFEINGRNVDAPVQEIDYVKLFGDDKGVGGVLDMSKDVVRLYNDIDDNNALIKALYTEKGFKAWLTHKAYMTEINATIDKKKKEAEQPPVQVGDKKYEVGRSYELQKGMELPTVEEGTQKGVQKFFTKDFWGGIGAKLSFKTKEEAEEAAQKNKENFEKELKTVTIVGTELDKNGNIKVRTASGRIENIDPALLDSHVATELPEEIVNSQRRYDINKELKKHMDEVEAQNPFFMSVENFEDATDPDTLGAMLQEADIDARGRLKRSPFVYGATIQPPNGRPYVENAQVFFSNHDQVAKLVKKRGGQLKMMFVTSNNAQALGLGEVWTKPDGTKGSVIDYLNHGTSAAEVNHAGDVRKYEAERQKLQDKLDGLEDTPENADQRKDLKSELAHIKNLIDNAPNLVSYNQANVNERTIATVVVEKVGNEWHYINSKGERVGGPSKDIEAKKASIETRRKEALKEQEYQVPVKVETYDALNSNDDSKISVQIRTVKSGKKVLYTSEDGKTWNRIDDYPGEVSNDKILEFVDSPSLSKTQTGDEYYADLKKKNPSKLTVEEKVNARYDAELKALDGSSDLRSDDLVINLMPVGMEGGVMKGDKRFQGGVSREEEVGMLDAWRKKRDAIFAETSSEPQTYSYDVSRGFPKRVPDPDQPGKWKQFPVVGSLIEKEDLHELGLIGVVTEKGVSYMGGNLAAPNGSLVIRKGKLLQFLNNRKLNTNEIDNIFEILKDFSKTIDDVRSIPYTTKDEGEQKKREVFKAKLTDITNYLQGALYYGRNTNATADDGNVNKGQLYIAGSDIIIGREKNVSVKIPFTQESFDPQNPYNRIDQLKEALAALYTNANSLKASENKPFKELYIERNADGSVKHKSRIWKSYQHYLLSDTIDLDESDKNYEQDGKEQRHVDSVPFRTSVAPKEEGKSNFQGQYAAMKKTEKDEYLFEHIVKKSDKKETKPASEPKPPISKTESAEPIQGKLEHPAFKDMFGVDFNYKVYPDGKVEVKSSDIDKSVEYITSPAGKDAVIDMLVAQGLLTKADAKNIDNVKLVTKLWVEGYIKSSIEAPIAEAADGSLTDQQIKTKVEESYKDKEQPKQRRGGGGKPKARMMNPQEMNYALHDIEKSEAWLSANIPVSGKRVYNLIAATGGGFAWGEYCDTHIKYYVNAKKGTIEHEAFEAIWWSFTSMEERAGLMKEFRAREGEFTHHEDWRQVKYKDATDYEIKEQLAEEFGRYVLDGKTPPIVKKQRSSNLIVRLFQDLINFVKGIFDGSIEKYFSKINTGKYKTAPRLNDFRGLDGMEKYSRLKIGALNETDTHAITRGVTSRVIQQLFSDSKTLIEFDTRRFKGEALFNKVLRRIHTDFENVVYDNEGGVRPATFEESDPRSSQSMYEDGLITKEQYEAHLRLWNTIQTHWASESKVPESDRQGSIIDNVREYLKLFGIRHDADESGINEERPNYQFKDVFEVDNDKTMSASMKLLFSTIVEQVRDPESGEIVERIDPATNMPIPVNFSKLTGFVREALTDCNTFGEKMTRLAEMSKTDPNIAKILERLKIDPETGMTMQNVNINLDDLKLRAAFNNTFGKQRPDAIAMYVHEDGNTIFSAQNLNSSTLKQVSDWVDGLKLTVGEPGSPFVESKVAGEEGQYKFDGSKFTEGGVKGKLDAEKQIAFLNSLGIDFTQEMIDKLSTEKQPGQARSDKDEFVESVRALYTYLPKTKDVNVIKAGDIGAAGRLKTLSQLYLKALGFEESIFFNIENRQQSQDVGHNFISTSTNDINNTESREDLNAKLPHMMQPFRADSWYLNRFLFENGKRLKDRNLSLTYIQGVINEKAGEYNETLASMAHPQRVLAELKANLNQLYYVLVPADSKTEWALKMQHIVKWDTMHDAGAAEAIYNRFKDYYTTEKALSEGDPNYKSLMYEINGGYGEEMLDKNKLMTYIENRVNSLFDYLVKTGGVTEASDEKGVYLVDNFPTAFAKEVGITVKKGTGRFSEAGLKNLFRFTETNYMLNNIEIHKLFFGDISKIKDPLKRYKSFMSPRETSMHDNPEFNNVLNENLNKAADTGRDLKLDPNMEEDQFVKRSVQLTKNDYGHWNHTDEIKTVTTKDQMVYESSIANDERLHAGSPNLRAQLQDAYKHINPTDGSGVVVLMAHREMMYKRGQITKAHDKLYDYLLALDRQLLLEDGHLQTTDETKKDYYRPELKSADERIVKRGYGLHPEDTATLDVLKPVYSGMDNSGNLVLDKYSLAPLTYALTRKGPLEKMYLKMVNDGIHYAVQDSGRKIGAQEMYDVYKEDGTVNNDNFTPTQQRSLMFKYFGIQTETGGRHDHNSFGTQMSTEFALNTLSKGVPTDYDGKSGDWDNLSHKEKMEKSPRYREIAHVYEVTKAMQNHGYSELLSKFGIIEDAESEKFIIPAAHMPKVEKLLREELLRRDVSQNLKDGLTWDKEKGQWAIPLEAMANYKQIKQILFSYVDKFIAKPKQNGGAKIMVPGILIGNVDGKIIKTIRVKGKEEVRYVSDGLKFYEAQYDANGKRTSVARMEVMITSDLPKKMRRHPRWKDATDQEIMDHLNTAEGKKLMEGIGFRIPTQEMNSLEAFTIKGFLPDYLGDTVVVPEAITTKAGSDFDVDKLQTYVKNAYIDKEGNVKMVPYKGIGEVAIDGFRLLAKELITVSEKTKEQTSDEYSVDMNTSEELSEDEIDNILSEDNKAEKIEELAQKLYKESLQNEYYDSLAKAILNPENYERLVKPNSADMMKNISKSLEGLAPNEFTADKKGSVLDRMFMSQARHAFITGKDGVAVAANNQKGHSVMQLAKVVIEPKFIRRLTGLEQQFVGDGSILLPHNKAKVNYDYELVKGRLVKVPFEQGRWLPTISGDVDNINHLISDNLSQGIDGYVDVAKGAWIMNIIQDPMTSSPFFAMLRFGINPATAAYFINQPIIREYIKILAREGQTFMTKRPDSPERREIFDMFPIDVPNKTEAEKKEFGKNVLKAIANRAKDGIEEDGLNSRLTENIKDFYNHKFSGQAHDEVVFNSERNLEQHMILQEFLKYKVYSDNLFSMQEAMTWDTKSMAEPNLQNKKRKLVDKARTTNIFDGIDDVFDATHLGSLMDNVSFMSDAMDQSMFEIGAQQVRKYIRQVLDYLPSRMSSDNYQIASQGIEEHFISYLVQNSKINEISNPVFSSKDRSEEPINTRIKELLVNKDTSIAKRLKALRKMLAETPDSDLARNEFIRRLAVKTRKNVAEVKNLFLASKPADPTSSDVITNTMREMRASTINLTHNDLYNDILIAAYLQSGMSNSALAFNKYIPVEDFARIVKPAIMNLINSTELQEAYVRTDSFFRNKWKDDRIIPKLKEKWEIRNDQLFKSRFRSQELNKAWIKFREDASAPWADVYGVKVQKEGEKPRSKYKFYHPFKIPVDSKEAQFDFVHLVAEDPFIADANITASLQGEQEQDASRHFLLKKVRDVDGRAVELEGGYIYIPISTLGDGMLAQEHYTDEQSIKSVLKTDGQQIPYEISNAEILDFIKDYQLEQQDKRDRATAEAQGGLPQGSLSLETDLEKAEKSRIFAEDELKAQKVAELKANFLQITKDLKKLFYKFDVENLGTYGVVERTDTTGAYYVEDSKINDDNTITLQLVGKQEGAMTHWVTLDTEGNILRVKGSSGREVETDPTEAGAVIFPGDIGMKLAQIHDRLKNGNKVEKTTVNPEPNTPPPAPKSEYDALPEKFTKTGKTQEYKTSEGQTVQGYKIAFEGHPDMQLFIHKVSEGQWVVREAERGIQIGDGGRTIKEAVKSVTDLINSLLHHQDFMNALKLNKKNAIDPNNIQPDGLPPLDITNENNC